METGKHSLGSGHSYDFVYDSDSPSPIGILEYHRSRKDESVCIEPLIWSQIYGPNVVLVSLEPLHLAGMPRCEVCGQRGYISFGQYHRGTP